MLKGILNRNKKNKKDIEELFVYILACLVIEGKIYKLAKKITKYQSDFTGIMPYYIVKLKEKVDLEIIEKLVDLFMKNSVEYTEKFYSKQKISSIKEYIPEDASKNTLIFIHRFYIEKINFSMLTDFDFLISTILEIEPERKEELENIKKMSQISDIFI